MTNKLIAFKKNIIGIVVCLAIAVPAWFIGNLFPVIGGPVIAIVIGMIISLFWNDKKGAANGIKFTSKVILQSAVVLLGFGLNLNVILKTGLQSLPVIVSTISTSLILSFVFHKIMRIPSNISTLVGVGSSICGGSAVAATAPVIEADDDEVAQAISVIFFFNLIAAIFFPLLGNQLGFSHTSGDAFGLFAGTAINDTSSVTSAASTWDAMFNLGTKTLDKAVTVKLTRTLAIIPITLVLAIITSYKKNKELATTDSAMNNSDVTSRKSTGNFSFKRAFPMFLLYFILASIFTTVAINMGAPTNIFNPLKDLSKFFIIMAMAAVGLNSNIIKLIKTGGKPILLGGICWIGITIVSLFVQHIIGIW